MFQLLLLLLLHALSELLQLVRYLQRIVSALQVFGLALCSFKLLLDGHCDLLVSLIYQLHARPPVVSLQCFQLPGLVDLCFDKVCEQLECLPTDLRKLQSKPLEVEASVLPSTYVAVVDVVHPRVIVGST